MQLQATRTPPLIFEKLETGMMPEEGVSKTQETQITGWKQICGACGSIGEVPLQDGLPLPLFKVKMSSYITPKTNNIPACDDCVWWGVNCLSPSTPTGATLTALPSCYYAVWLVWRACLTS
jgi:hypothetical protein